MEIGDRVILIKGSYKPSEHNPFKGTQFFCAGTIDGIGGDESLYVQWDNGRHNSYDSEDLKKNMSFNEEQLNNL